MDEIKVCAYCGTEYPANRQTCPLCGMNDAEARKARDQAELEYAGRSASSAPAEEAPHTKDRRRKGGARVAPRKKRGKDRIPTWMTVLICIILAIALFIGIVFAVTSIKSIINAKTPTLDEADPVVSLPDQDQTNDNQDDEANSDDTTDIKPNDDDTTTLDNQTDQSDNPDNNDQQNTVACTSLSINYSDVTLNKAGDSFTITAKVLPDNCTEEVVWSSSDDAICSVENGKVVAVDGGTATITATCGEKTISCIVRCDFAHTGAGANTSSGNYSLSSTDFTLFSAGETTTLTVSGAGSETVTWSSSDDSVATVSSSGTVKAVGSGTATITASVGGKSLNAIVRCNFRDTNVQTPPENTTETGSVTLSHTDVTISAGESFTLSVTGASNATYSTSNAAVCTANGSTITGVASGTATITVNAGGQQLSCIVRVK